MTRSHLSAPRSLHLAGRLLLSNALLGLTFANAQLPDLLIEPSLQKTLVKLRTETPVTQQSTIELNEGLSPLTWRAYENYGNSSPQPFIIRSGSLLEVEVAKSPETATPGSLPERQFWRLRALSSAELLAYSIPDFQQAPASLAGTATIDSDGFVYSFTTDSTGQYLTLQEGADEVLFYAEVSFTYSYQNLGAGMAALNLQFNDPALGISGLLRFDSATSFESLFSDFSNLGSETYSTDDLEFTTVIPTAPTLALPSLVGRTLQVAGFNSEGEPSSQNYQFMSATQLRHPSASRGETELTSSYTLQQLGTNSYRIQIFPNGVEPASELLLFIQSLTPEPIGRAILNSPKEEAEDIIDFGIFTLLP